MIHWVSDPRHRRRKVSRPRHRLHLETLEKRDLLTATIGPALTHQTLDQAFDLGNLSSSGQVEALGTIGSGISGAADVNWYSFTLTSPASVTLTTPTLASTNSLSSVLTLYNSDPFDFADPYDLLGHRLLAQDVTVPGHEARIDRQLAGGTYYVAVSGSGNQYFHPFLSGSGYAGATGDYDLSVTAADLGLCPTSNPVLLAMDPVPGSVLDQSPLMIRMDFSAPIDANTINVGQNVWLTMNPDRYGQGIDTNIGLAAVNFTPVGSDPLLTGADELQIIPAAPLGPGYYTIHLGGDPNTNSPPLADLAGNPLGQDFTYNFQVNGIEGNTGANPLPIDTRATAHDLGDVTAAGIVQVAGVIGTDPTDPVPFNPAEVEMYHFHVSGPGRFAFTGEVFANRIGSPLDSGLSLFQDVGSNLPLHLIAGNDNTQNGTQSDNGAYTPLATDSAVYAGLTEGDYYVAVSSGGNVPNPFLALWPGSQGIFDPDRSHSATAGTNIGPYVLNLFVQPFNEPAPQVIASTPASGSTLTSPPTQLEVQFNEPVNLQQAAFAAFEQVQAGITPQQPVQGIMPAVYVQGADGNYYYPRLLSYDTATNQATFLMLDRLPNGINRLHLSGAQGITDFAGNPLVANDFSGDYVVSFTVNSSTAGATGNIMDQPVTESVAGQLVDLGVLFPHELQAGVTVVRSHAPAQGTGSLPSADYYWFQVLEGQNYVFTLSGISAPSNIQFTLFDSAWNPVPAQVQGGGSGLLAILQPGRYGIGISGLTAALAGNTTYELHLVLGRSADQPLPLLSGPAPAIRIRLVNNAPADLAEAPPPLVVRVPLGSDSNPGAATVVVQTNSNPATVSGAILTIPTGVLLALGTGPVGGVTGISRSETLVLPDRVAVRAPDSPLLEGLLTLTVLTQSSGMDLASLSGAARPSGLGPLTLGGLGKWMGESISALALPVERTLDLFFQFENWLDDLGVWEGSLIRPKEPEFLPEDGASEFELGDEQDSVAACNWAATLAALGTAAVVEPGKRQARVKESRPHRAND